MVLNFDDDLEDWAKKCMSCTHCYKKKNDDEYIYCRCRNGKCNYKPSKKIKEIQKMKE